MVYPYTEGDRIREPNTYFYSSCDDPAFLEAWQSCRRAVADRFPEPARGPALKGDRSASGGRPYGDTSALLQVAMAQADALRPGAPFEPPLRSLLHKFETTKRLHRAYDDQFRAVDRGRNRDLSLYLGLAEVFERGYERIADLRLLNALLKILDTLCSVHEDLSDEEGARLSRLLIAERRLVTELSRKLIEPL